MIDRHQQLKQSRVFMDKSQSYETLTKTKILEAIKEGYKSKLFQEL